MKYNAFDLVGPAWIHTKKILGKFSFNKWLYYAFVIFMSSTALGFNINYTNLLRNNNLNSNSSLGTTANNNEALAQWIKNFISSHNIAHETIIYLGIALFIFGIIFSCIWIYLSCNFTYILNDSVLLNKTDIMYLWNKNSKKSKSYFSLVIRVVIYMLLAVIFFSALSVPIFSKSGSVGANIGLFILGIICFCSVIMFIAIYMQIIANCVLPLHLKMDENISIFEASKIVFKDLKKDIGKTLISLFIILLVYGIFSFILGTFAFMFNVAGVLCSIFLSQTNLILILTLCLFIYVPVILFLNVPIVIFLTSYKLLVMSYLSPENAILLPLQDEKGKFIGTMSYFEHLEREKEASEAQMTNNHESYPSNM